MTDPYCAKCGDKVTTDSDHVRVAAEIKRPRDRNDRNEYYFHNDCWSEVSQEWTEPV